MKKIFFRILSLSLTNKRSFISLSLLLTLFLFYPSSLFASSVVLSFVESEQSTDSVSTSAILSVYPMQRDSLLHMQGDSLKNMEKTAQPKLKTIDPLSALKEHNRLLKKEMKQKAKDSFVLASQQENTEALNDTTFRPVLLDTLQLRANPFFIDLVYMGVDITIDWKLPKEEDLFLNEDSQSLSDPYIAADLRTPTDILSELRRSTLGDLVSSNIDLYKLTYEQLPSLSWNTYEILKGDREKLFFDDPGEAFVIPGKIEFRVRDFSNWSLKVNTLLQFSQISVSDNWHKGGDSYFTVLGIVSSRMDYADRKSIKWENSLELRTGLNTVPQDSLRSIIPSDDLLKGNSKLGVKAGKNLYYSSSLEFQTQFFDNPKKINSRELKAKFLTPIRLNLGIGIDYKPTKFLSVAVSPLSYKVIYLADTSPNIKYPEARIKPNAFGIKDGQNLLHEFGSKLIVVLKEYTPWPDLKIDSRFTFYTNYEKVEIDCELVAEYTLNRFLSTRLMLNPRFDNTAILKNDEKARLQHKQMLTIGVSYRLY